MLVHRVVLQMISKDRDLTELLNLRPIVLLPIYKKLCSKFIYLRISSYLCQRQFSNQYDCMSDKLIEDGLICAEVTIEYQQELNL